MRVRFAPSPTGPLHAGNVRTAIFNWLFARHEGGKLILRIEDTDEARSEKKYADEITDSLKWLGIDWDEGPYYQSENRAEYEKAVKKLLDDKKLYPCFCTEEELTAQRKAAAKAGRPPVYLGTCKNLGDEEASARMEKEPYALRFRIEGSRLSYTDAIRGETEVNLNLLGDFIVTRSGGQAVYNLAAAVDDAAMKITHVLRGEDHISNTPRQILLLEALGYKKPVYAHLPIILSKDGTKLSKRDGHRGVSFGDLIRGGYLPEAVFNFLALIGWHPEDGTEEMGMDELASKFSLKRVAVRSAQYDIGKLDWLNGLKIRATSPERLLELGKGFLGKHAAKIEGLPEEKKEFLMESVRDNLSTLRDLEKEIAPFFELEFEEGVKNGLDGYRVEDVVSVFLKHCETPDFKNAANMTANETGAKGKSLYMPLRAALSGRLKGPELKRLYGFLNAGERKKRLKDFLEFYKK